MPTSYVVKQGDHLSSIAQQFGFADYRTIWNHADNSALRQKRKDPHTLYPGDTIQIPDKRQKNVNIATTAVHKFRLKDAPLMLRLVVRDFDHQPLANTPCELEVEGTVYKLTSDGQGKIETKIPKTAQSGVLRIPELELEIPVKVGHLDPLDEEEGWRARLGNLGYHWEPLDGADEDAMRMAIEEFQCDHDVKVTGVLDDATRAKLKELHGA